jgi:hypothetical protein
MRMGLTLKFDMEENLEDGLLDSSGERGEAEVDLKTGAPPYIQLLLLAKTNVSRGCSFFTSPVYISYSCSSSPRCHRVTCGAIYVLSSSLLAKVA